MLFGQGLDNGRRVFTNNHEIVDIDSDVLVVITFVTHPNITFDLGRDETHIAEDAGKTFVPAKTGTLEAVQGLSNDKGMSLSVTKFRAGDDVYLFLSVRFKIGVTDVSSPDLEIVELSHKGEEPNTTEGDNAQVDRVNRSLRKVTSSNKAGFVSPVVFDCIYHMHLYLFIIGARVATETKIFERRKRVDHKELNSFCVGQFRVTVATIKRHGLLVVTRYLEALHVDGLGAERVEFGLLGMAENTLLCLCKLPESR